MWSWIELYSIDLIGLVNVWITILWFFCANLWIYWDELQSYDAISWVIDLAYEYIMNFIQVSNSRLWTSDDLLYNSSIGLVIILDTVVWWYYTHCWVDLRVDVKTLIMALWRRLSKSCDLYSLLQLRLLVINWWCCIEVYLMLRFDRVGMILNLNVLTMVCEVLAKM